MNFFKTKPRTPPDLVRGLRDAINRLESGAPGGETRRKVWINASSFKFHILFCLLNLHPNRYRPQRTSRRIFSRSKVSYTAMVVRYRSGSLNDTLYSLELLFRIFLSLLLRAPKNRHRNLLLSWPKKPTTPTFSFSLFKASLDLNSRRERTLCRFSTISFVGR